MVLSVIVSLRKCRVASIKLASLESVTDKIELLMLALKANFLLLMFTLLKTNRLHLPKVYRWFGLSLLPDNSCGYSAIKCKRAMDLADSERFAVSTSYALNAMPIKIPLLNGLVYSKHAGPFLYISRGREGDYFWQH